MRENAGQKNSQYGHFLHREFLVSRLLTLFPLSSYILLLLMFCYGIASVISKNGNNCKGNLEVSKEWLQIDNEIDTIDCFFKTAYFQTSLRNVTLVGLSLIKTLVRVISFIFYFLFY